MQQNDRTLAAFDALLRAVRPRRVVELGTGLGGLAVYLQLWCVQSGARLVTYDKNDRRHCRRLFELLAIDYRQIDIFSDDGEADVRRALAGGGPTVLLCDDGDKRREWRTFAPALKVGDVALAHDYARDRRDFNERVRGRLWRTLEIGERDVREPEGFEPLLEDLFLEAAWVCKMRAS